MFSFYGSDIESVLTFSIIEWFGSSTAQQRSQISHITQLWSSHYWWGLCLTFAEKWSYNPESSLTSSQTSLYASEQLKLSLHVFWTALIVGLCMLLIALVSMHLHFTRCIGYDICIDAFMSKSALLSILPHVQLMHTENWNCVTLRLLVHTDNTKH